MLDLFPPTYIIDLEGIAVNKLIMLGKHIKLQGEIVGNSRNQEENLRTILNVSDGYKS